MLFNSLAFAVFLPIVFVLYWFVTNRSLKLQNLLIIAASYFFYGLWNWRFLILILFTTVVDYSVALLISQQKENRRRKSLLMISVLTNLFLLGFFKYFNFFVSSFIAAFSFLGLRLDAHTLNIILPVGISFYTFQNLSYTIDVYRGKLQPTKDIIGFSAFISFFPQLVAGPIERAIKMLPQFQKERHFDYDLAVDGLRQILWGLFKKIVIADNCAAYANIIFNHYGNYSGSTLFLGAIFFAFQIYGDFSGYSDIAIGLGRLFGIELRKNFSFPYFSRDIAEFWRRWHISLTSWFRDYIYIPLGGSRDGKWRTIRNTFIIFLVSGLWHGARWTFVAWGLINAIYFLPLLLSRKNRTNLGVVAEGKVWPTFSELYSVAITFILTTLAWIFFRAESIGQAWAILARIFSRSFISIPEVRPLSIIGIVIAFVIVEWFGRENEYAIAKLGENWRSPVRWFFYIGLATAIFVFFGVPQKFIYFQF